MLFQPSTVELTKIHYYDETRKEIPTISREIVDNQVNSNVVIRRNLFRHRWVLKINEIGVGKEKFQWRLVYILVLCCLLVAVIFGLYFTCFEPPKTVEFGTIFTTSEEPTTHQKMTFAYCRNCTHVCLKRSESDVPQCVKPRDTNDPTGCGGICAIGTQFCQLLDGRHRLYQCSNLKATLKCPAEAFNCGNMCINGGKRCDGVIHCSNKSDEMDCDCDLKTHFRCSNKTSCLSKSKRCDGVVDCWDKSDEIDCILCETGTLPCRNGDCVSKDHFCDGKFHCKDHSDEPQGCQL